MSFSLGDLEGSRSWRTYGRTAVEKRSVASRGNALGRISTLEIWVPLRAGLDVTARYQQRDARREACGENFANSRWNVFVAASNWTIGSSMVVAKVTNSSAPYRRASEHGSQSVSVPSRRQIWERGLTSKSHDTSTIETSRFSGLA